MHAHLKAGWTYSEYVGAFGGWENDNASGLVAIACKATRRARTWQAFVVRSDDGVTLYRSEHKTRDEAMSAAISARSSDVTRHAGDSVPMPELLVY